LGLALHNYHDVYNSFPPGYIREHTASSANWSNTHDAWGWAAFLLPYIEQTALYNSLNVGIGFPPDVVDNPGNLAAAQTQLTIFRCPSDIGPNLYPNEADTTYLREVALSNYVASMRSAQAMGSQGTVGFMTSNDPKRGGFFANSHVKIRDIIDGTSNTIAIGERVYQYPGNAGTPVYAAAWIGCGRADKETRCARQLFFAPEKPINGGGRSNTTLSSVHAGGVQVTLFDGSVRFVSENIDHHIDASVVPGSDDPVDSTLEYLIAIADGSVVGEF
ncbi:MAG: DUF1559 domain-containing protein, partial [Planctomycetaceae bacterium]|nr:DUF1559 domain-containing protein [Planctomycetaceae bacterium]